MFLVMTGPQVFLDRGSHPQTQSDFVFEELLGLLVWPAAGALSGWALWVIHERQKSKNRIPGSR